MPHAWLQSVMGKTDALTSEEIEMGLANMKSATEQGWNQMFAALAPKLA